LYKWLTLFGFSPISQLCAQLHEFPETDHCQKLSPSTPLMWNAAFIYWTKLWVEMNSRYSRAGQIRRFLIVFKYNHSMLFYIKLSLRIAKTLPLSMKEILSMMKFWYQTVFDLMHRKFYILGQKGHYKIFYMSGEGLNPVNLLKS